MIQDFSDRAPQIITNNKKSISLGMFRSYPRTSMKLDNFLNGLFLLSFAAVALYSHVAEGHALCR